MRRVNIETGLWCKELSLPVKVFIQNLQITSLKTSDFITETRIDAAEMSLGLPHLDHRKLSGTPRKNITPKLQARPLVCYHDWIFNV